MPSTWLVRADTGGRLAPEFRARQLVAIGWIDAGDTVSLATRESFLERMKEVYPEDSRHKQFNAAGQVYRFVREIQIGDQVVTYDNARRTYLVGRISSEARYDVTLFEGQFRTFRTVEWVHEVSRDALTVKAKNTLGSTLTLFRVPPETVTEIEALMRGAQPRQPDDQEEALEEEDLFQDLQLKSQEFIKDRLSKLDWEQMQHLTAGLLRAMGYKTKVSPPGPDRGKDIVASPDGFGFEQPRIIVEVKHRRGQMGTHDIRGFLAVLRPGDKGLYVSTGGFSRDAYLEAERALHPITLMDLEDLGEAILEHYEHMDLETRVLLPLRRIYWPA